MAELAYRLFLIEARKIPEKPFANLGFKKVVDLYITEAGALPENTVHVKRKKASLKKQLSATVDDDHDIVPNFPTPAMFLDVAFRSPHA